MSSIDITRPNNRRHLSRSLTVALALVTAMVASGSVGTNVAHGDPPAPGDNTVLVYGPSVTGGVASIEATTAAALGFTVEVVDGATWSAMTAAQFDSYRALLIGDPTCSAGHLAAAESNVAVWSSVVDGNVVVNGTDPVFHSFQGGETLTQKSVAFAVDEAGKTGLYVSLSCEYDSAGPLTPVDVLSGLGTFTVQTASCYNDAHIVATHPAIAGLTDADLSNWFCSVHEQFDSWPATFQVLAIAERPEGTYTAADGSVGFPYVLARGEGLVAISDITLTPGTETNPVGSDHTVTATVESGEPSAPVVGTTVTFTVLSGPHAGTTGMATTDANGVATFTYTGTAAGTDTIQASFVDAEAVTQSSNIVEKIWEGTVPTEEKVSGSKYYDANTNGQRDAGEPGIGGWMIDVTNGAIVSLTTDTNGDFSLDVDPGMYTVAEQASGAPWHQTGNTVDQSGGTGDVTLNSDMTYAVDLGVGESATGLDFGNVCVGGTGAHTKGFWQNRNGETAFQGTDGGAGALALLNGLNLKGATGADVTFTSYTQFRTWIRSATARNSAYMLSAQLAALALDRHVGYVAGGELIVADSSASANAAGFATVDAIIAEANASLGVASPSRSLQLLLSDIIDAANNDLSFVQAGPGDCPPPTFPVTVATV
jgi:hypothetical protein